MKNIGRIAVVVLVTLATFYLVFWFSQALIPFGAYGWLPPIIALVCAVAAGRYVWISHGSTSTGGAMPTALLWALMVGGISFVLGFVGPMIFAPSANQGPMLGIFITGPLGFLLGGIAGFVYSRRRKHKQDSPGNDGGTD
jgi:hypothetical protein